MLVIIAISDLEEKSEGGCLKVPEAEMASSGLSQFRNAYVHVLEYNVDRETHSVTYLPRDGVKGRFSKPFIERIAKALAENIRLGRAAQIVRN